MCTQIRITDTKFSDLREYRGAPHVSRGGVCARRIFGGKAIVRIRDPFLMLIASTTKRKVQVVVSKNLHCRLYIGLLDDGMVDRSMRGLSPRCHRFNGAARRFPVWWEDRSGRVCGWVVVLRG